jgi:hypothetical protein
MSDWTTTDLKQRSIAAKEYRGYANIPVGEATYEVPYELLSHDQQLEVQGDINLEALAETDGAVDLDEETETAEQRVQELQSKDDLTEVEKQELREAQQTLMQNNAELVDKLGSETLKAFHKAGRMAIAPDTEDVNNVMDNPIEAKERFADIPGAPAFGSGEITREAAARALKAEMRSILDDNPLPIYFTLGQQVFEESQSAGKLADDSESDQ